MTLMTRIARLFRADIHAVLDRIEEPDLLLRQAIREMEEDLDRDRRQLQALEREQARLAAREAELQGTLPSIDEELNLCFNAGKDDLARALVRRKLEIGRAQKAAAQKRETLDAQRADLQSRIAENRAQLDDIRQKAEVLADSAADHGRDVPACGRSDFAIRDEDVEVAFLREKQRRGQP